MPKKLRFLQEKLFRYLGLGALCVGLGTLLLLCVVILIRGYTAFCSTEIFVTLEFEQPVTSQNLEKSLSQKNLEIHFARSLSRDYPHLKTVVEELNAVRMISWGARKNLKEVMQKHFRKSTQPLTKLQVWVLASDEADGFYKERCGLASYDVSRLLPDQKGLLDTLEKQAKLRLVFNGSFLTNNDSTLPELAGMWGAFVGSVLLLGIALFVSFPIGLGSAIYLEELAPLQWWVPWVDLKLTNLASIPSVIFGLLSFIVFDYYFHLPRPSPLLGGLTIGLAMAPWLMVTIRLALQSVPSSIRRAARALGASHAQIVLHHVLPMAFPHIVTGVLLTISRALGESAPILMVGMVAFVGNTPHTFTDASTALPTQIFSWSKASELGFVSKTAGGILGLFFLLFVLNGLTFGLRSYYKRKA